VNVDAKKDDCLPSVALLKKFMIKIDYRLSYLKTFKSEI